MASAILLMDLTLPLEMGWLLQPCAPAFCILLVLG